MTAREAFLQRVRQAVTAGNRAGQTPPLPARGATGYQGAGDDVLEKFRLECQAAGAFPLVVADRQQAREAVLDRVNRSAARKILLGRNGVLDAEELARDLRAQGRETLLVDELSDASGKAAMFGADLGISGVEYLIAESGTLVMASRAEDPRSLSLLPPMHIALAGREQILPDLFDLFARLELTKEAGAPVMPSCLTLITGPSKTGDIELKLVTGVHGPGEVFVIICDRS